MKKNAVELIVNIVGNVIDSIASIFWTHNEAEEKRNFGRRIFLLCSPGEPLLVGCSIVLVMLLSVHTF
jgi:hypothetical protein